MTKASELPLYQQVAQRLTRDIAAGRLVEGQRLPPERDHCQQLGVSIGTLRKALAELTGKGLLERVQGSGNYVRQGVAATATYSMFRLELIGGGGLPSADLLSLEKLAKPGDLPDFGSSSHAWRFRRLRRLDQVPVALEEIWLDGSVPDFDPSQVGPSMYLFYQEVLGFWITRAQDWVSVAVCPDWGALGFEPMAGDILGFAERQSFSNSDVAVEYSRSWFDVNHCRYVQNL